MKIRVLGGGWYGCSIALGLKQAGHYVELHEIADHLFAGASGGNPARLHLGFHYPRSGLTVAACLDHRAEFMKRYGALTRGVPTNLYAVADQDSLVDYAQYLHAFAGRVQFIEVDPTDHGLRHVEGAVLTGERHIVIEQARAYFTRELGLSAHFNKPPGEVDSNDYDWTVDCTFCANDAENIDRFEPCITAIINGPTSKAVTIMDGPFGSIYPWDEQRGLLSLTHAALTPLTKTIRTHEEARALLKELPEDKAFTRCYDMQREVSFFWPAARHFNVVDYKLSIRAMPKSAADTRLVDVVKVGERALRVRAGKIDAVFHAERVVKDFIAAGHKSTELFHHQV